MKLKNKWAKCILYLMALVWLQGCGVYSFTGAALSPDTKTISVAEFANIAGGGPPNLSQRFGQKLRDFYQRNTPLAIARQDGDLQIEGTVTGYTIMPVAPTGNESAAQMRLTITVQLKFVNTKDETKNFESSFSQYEDYPQDKSIVQVEGPLIENITDKLMLDIFNRTVGDW